MLVAGRSPDPRADPRSNVYLSAVLTADGRSRPVRVRNLSARGALIDGSELPAAGSEVCLVRANHRAIGEVAWAREGHCGVRFAAELAVADWVRKVEHSGQQRVDQTMAFLRAKAAGTAAGPVLIHEQDSLAAISADLQGLSHRLANNSELIARYANDLLILDAICQRLGQAVARG